MPVSRLQKTIPANVSFFPVDKKESAKNKSIVVREVKSIVNIGGAEVRAELEKKNHDARYM